MWPPRSGPLLQRAGQGGEVNPVAAVEAARAAPQRTRNCVSCGLRTLPNDHGFARVELGYPVANWFPVDVDEDGT